MKLYASPLDMKHLTVSVTFPENLPALRFLPQSILLLYCSIDQSILLLYCHGFLNMMHAHLEILSSNCCVTDKAKIYNLNLTQITVCN